MVSDHILYLFFIIIYSTYCQSLIRIGIIDDNDNPRRIVNINLSNITFCGGKDLHLQLHWINTSNSLSTLFNQLEFKQNFTNIYLTHTSNFYTKLIRDFSQTNHIPFINLKSDESKTILCSLTTFVFFENNFPFNNNHRFLS